MGRLVVWMLLVMACSSDPKTPCEKVLNEESSKIAKSGLKGVIYSFQFKGETYYEIIDCVSQCSDMLSRFYNCSGKQICYAGGIGNVNTCPDFTGATEPVVVWKN